MSGPKKSQYEIRQEIYQARKEAQRAKRQKQVSQINNELIQASDDLMNLQIIYGDLAYTTVMKVNEWISELKNNINGDLRDTWRSLNGIKNYLSKQDSRLNNLMREREKRFEKNEMEEEVKLQKLQKIEEEKAIYQAKIETTISFLSDIKSDYKDIINDGIRERIDLFKNSIKANPENKNTLSQINIFKEQLEKQYQEYQESAEDTKYVATVFSNALDGDIKIDNNNNIEISGSIDGVPISVKLKHNNRDIDLDTPLDGSCKRGLDAINKKLNQANITLGPIKVVKTGQILNSNSQNNSNKRMKI